jgi:hypothetical protein
MGDLLETMSYQWFDGDAVIASIVPSRPCEATPDSPVDWIPVIHPVDGLSEHAVEEQSQAFVVYTNAIDWFTNPLCASVKFPCLVGRPGSGNSHVLKIACAYAICKGLQVELMSLTSERARKLGGNHMHLVFPLPVNKARAFLSNTLAYDCLKTLNSDPMKKLIIKRADVFYF